MLRIGRSQFEAWEKTRHAEESKTVTEEEKNPGELYRSRSLEEWNTVKDHTLSTSLRTLSHLVEKSVSAASKQDLIKSTERFVKENPSIVQKALETLKIVGFALENSSDLLTSNDSIYKKCSEIRKIAAECPHYTEAFKQYAKRIINKAKDFGFVGTIGTISIEEAQLYLKSLYQTVTTLIEESYLPSDLILKKKSEDELSTQEIEEIIYNLRHISSRELIKLFNILLDVINEKPQLIFNLSNLLCHYRKEKFLKVTPFKKEGAGLPKIPIYILVKAERKRQRENVLRLLLEHAQIDIKKNICGVPPLCLFISLKCEKISSLLIDLGADINAPDLGGVTPLMHAVSNENWSEFARLMISQGAKLSDKDEQDKDVLAYAYDNVTLKMLEGQFQMLENRSEPQNTPTISHSVNKEMTSEQTMNEDELLNELNKLDELILRKRSSSAPAKNKFKGLGILNADFECESE